MPRYNKYHDLEQPQWAEIIDHFKQEKDCNKCEFISITEEKQKHSREDHICTKTGERLFHRGQHPKLPMPDNCPIKECKQR